MSSLADICNGIIDGLRSGAAGVIQLGSGRPLSLNELFAAIGKVVQPSKVKVRHEPSAAGEVYATYCDVSKARNDLVFDPKTNLHDGLAKTWAWYEGKSRTTTA
jgi:nucleoside-diphosphate-sugar epimerase